MGMEEGGERGEKNWDGPIREGDDAAGERTKKEGKKQTQTKIRKAFAGLASVRKYV